MEMRKILHATEEILIEILNSLGILAAGGPPIRPILHKKIPTIH
jgi:hypothetical protein